MCASGTMPGLYYNQIVEAKRTRSAKIYFLVALTVGLWLLFAPKVLGGKVSYIVVSGNSMEPNFHKGDLVLTRELPGYEVGDAVAYYHPLLDGIVFHRVVEITQGRYFLQGDANNWLDSYTPASDEVLGKKWVRLEGFGRYLEKARQPEWLAAIVVSFVLMTIWPGDSVQDEDDDEVDSPGRERKKQKGRIMAKQQRIHELIYLFLSLAGIGIIGLVFFFTRPITEIVESFSNLKHQGAFSYEADSKEEVYQDGKAKTGEPVFRNASSSMITTFEYSQGHDAVENIQGTYQLSYEIKDESGWSRTVEVLPPTDFSADQLTFSGKIWFHQIDAVIKDFEEATLVSRGVYTLSIIPVVTIHVGGEGGLKSTFSPNLDFQFSDLEVRMLRSQEEDVLNPEQNFILADTTSQESSVDLLSFSIPVKVGRWMFGFLLVASLGAAGYLLWADVSAKNAGQAEAISYQYGDLIVKVKEYADVSERILVEDFLALVSLAERNRKNILYIEMRDEKQYFVILETKMYYFSIFEESAKTDPHEEPEILS